MVGRENFPLEIHLRTNQATEGEPILSWMDGLRIERMVTKCNEASKHENLHIPARLFFKDQSILESILPSSPFTASGLVTLHTEKLEADHVIAVKLYF